MLHLLLISTLAPAISEGTTDPGALIAGIMLLIGLFIAALVGAGITKKL